MSEPERTWVVTTIGFYFELIEAIVAENEKQINQLLEDFVQRILKIVRNTDDPKLLSGALMVLSSSNFLRLAGPQLTVKMIRADLTKSDFAVQLFNIENSYNEALDIREILKEMAIDIIKSPKEFALKVAIAAASYLAQYYPVNFPPLLSLEKELKLYVSV